jgi:hypothetical protein
MVGYAGMSVYHSDSEALASVVRRQLASVDLMTLEVLSRRLKNLFETAIRDLDFLSRMVQASVVCLKTAELPGLKMFRDETVHWRLSSCRVNIQFSFLKLLRNTL